MEKIMAESATDELTTENKNQKPDKIGKIQTVEKPAKKSSNDKSVNENVLAGEISLLSAVRTFLKLHGIRKSGAAIRDAVEMPHENFLPKQAVSALSSLGFKSSFGSMSVGKITKEMFPIIAFLNNNSVVVLKEMPSKTLITVIESGKGKDSRTIGLDEFKKLFTGYVILAKELNEQEKEVRSGHWFFSAFKKSKWIYVQVMIAAMVSNFLSLTTSLFTMTVYDRIIPNGAF